MTRPLPDAVDVLIVGAGPAGLSAAVAARAAGAERVLIVDRDDEAGGILPQCIHTGFGLHHFGEELTGPEYAHRALDAALAAGAEVLTGTFVRGIGDDGRVDLTSRATGPALIRARAVVLSTGARERTRGAIRIPGTRPAGVMTAGLAQKLVNQAGLLPGRRVVILGSGDIGLIMARRMTLEGAVVEGVYERMPHVGGLSRNVVQCLHDFDVPLHLSTTVTEILGRDRIEAVRVASVDAESRAVGAGRIVPCDTLLLSVGLIPEGELAHRLRLRLDPTTGGPLVDGFMATSRDGVFACGNAVHVHDLVDDVAVEAAVAGRAAAAYAAGGPAAAPDDIRLLPGENVRSCVPATIGSERDATLYLRVERAMAPCTLHLGDVHERPLRYVVPGEMVKLQIRPRHLHGFARGALRISITPRAANEQGAAA
jgi:NADPH-dependent 2,4-dienoyl-CoA reductase/sulfur reductase-like enzyme